MFRKPQSSEISSRASEIPEAKKACEKKSAYLGFVFTQGNTTKAGPKEKGELSGEKIIVSINQRHG
ncbi:hypothetical protein AQUSIP_02580 [Aquicella siphonis]|uniref:Uncharacterized protein n=1 Tax=Aquicella siphonis TaxID=254247 RepID=A0A5E4PDW1_9COXI|nr:hypothetical protein [Aquicella siphonis]VVC74984.1 hypothetical protein AQUSIP_02580 [Aquicella siphonis]